MSSKHALVTGGTDGIGKEIARGLARAGSAVVLVGRDADKGARAERELRETTGNADIWFLRADLSLLSEVHRVAGAIASRWSALHYLVHSAGIVRGRHTLTAEGVESNFAVNYLSRFALTWRLLPLLTAAGKPGHAARIVIVGGAGLNGTIYFDDVNLTSNFTTIRALKQFQHANNVFTVELARRLSASGGRPMVTITCINPGPVKTSIRREFPWWMKRLMPLLLDPWLTRTPEAAAEGALRLLLAEDLEGESGALFSTILKFKRLTPASRVRDPREGRRLWELSQRMTAVG